MIEYWNKINLKSFKGEIWKGVDIDWLLGTHEVSNFGRVKVFGKCYFAGFGWQTQPEYIKSQILGTHGYPLGLTCLQVAEGDF